ncbi:MAG: MucR family transcriptional regulator [Rickettsiales bacterium]
MATKKEDNTNENPILGATADIVSSYLLNHKVEVEQLDTLIQRVFSAVNTLGQDNRGNSLKPVVDVKSSITPDYIVCLEDGKKLKMLKRYLKTNYNMTPEEYKRRWGLPATYPMVAPNYAKKRSSLAKQIGLGKKSAQERKHNALAKTKRAA